MDPGVAGPRRRCLRTGRASRRLHQRKEFLATDCPLTWHGITLYGTYDVGVGWVSHGLPGKRCQLRGRSARQPERKSLPIRPRAEQPVADGTGCARQGGVSAWMVRGVQRLDRHRSGSGHAPTCSRPIPINDGPREAATPKPAMARALARRSTMSFSAGFPGALRHAHPGRERALRTDVTLQYDPASGDSFSYIG